MKLWLEENFKLAFWGTFAVTLVGLLITIISKIDEPISLPPAKDLIVWVPTLFFVGFFFFVLYVEAQKRRRIRRETLEAEIQSLQRQINDNDKKIHTRVANVVRQFTEFKKAVNESREEGQKGD